MEIEDLEKIEKQLIATIKLLKFSIIALGLVIIVELIAKYI